VKTDLKQGPVQADMILGVLYLEKSNGKKEMRRGEERHQNLLESTWQSAGGDAFTIGGRE